MSSSILAYSVFGSGVPLIIALLFVFPTLLILVGVATWADRRFARRGFFGTKRGQEPALAVKNSGEVDQRHGMLAVVRNNTETESMTASSTDAVIETNSEPTTALRNESLAPGQAFAAPESAGQWRNQLLPRPIDPGSPPQAAAPTPQLPIDPPAEAALEIGTVPPGEAPIEPIQERAPDRERQPVGMDEPRPPPTGPDFDANADQKPADMTRRLTAAIRGPAKKGAARSADPAQRTMTASLRSAGLRIVGAPVATSVAGAKSKSIYDALEIEMSDLHKFGAPETDDASPLN
jgi:hypothetical protein